MSEKNTITRKPRTGVGDCKYISYKKSSNDDSGDESNTGKQKTMNSSRTGVDAPKSISGFDTEKSFGE